MLIPLVLLLEKWLPFDTLSRRMRRASRSKGKTWKFLTAICLVWLVDLEIGDRSFTLIKMNNVMTKGGLICKFSQRSLVEARKRRCFVTEDKRVKSVLKVVGYSTISWFHFLYLGSVIMSEVFYFGVLASSGKRSILYFPFWLENYMQYFNLCLCKEMSRLDFLLQHFIYCTLNVWSFLVCLKYQILFLFVVIAIRFIHLDLDNLRDLESWSYIGVLFFYVCWDLDKLLICRVSTLDMRSLVRYHDDLGKHLIQGAEIFVCCLHILLGSSVCIDIGFGFLIWLLLSI